MPPCATSSSGRCPNPGRLRPGESRQALTGRAAATFAELAQSLRERGHDPQTVAHFVNRLVFCMFAEDVGLLDGMTRYIATPTVAKHRVFVWLDARVCPDHQLIVIARADDTTFGILHSRFHETWSLRLGTWLGKGNDPRYTPTTTFEIFPFPEGLSPDIPAGDRTTREPQQSLKPQDGSSNCESVGSIRPSWWSEWRSRLPVTRGAWRLAENQRRRSSGNGP